MRELRVSKFIPIEREKIFKYWTDPSSLEKWLYPDAMSLKVLDFEAQPQGRYHYQYTGAKGIYECQGYFKEFIPNERLVQLDSIQGPDQKMVLDDLESSISFRDSNGGTQISITQKNFSSPEMLRVCEDAWVDSLANLSNLLSGGMGIKPGSTKTSSDSDLSGFEL